MTAHPTPLTATNAADPSAAAINQALPLTDAWLARLDMPGPRYTSYPTADRFDERFDATAYRQALQRRQRAQAVGGLTPLSLYVHVPFCEALCWYCACNKIVTKHHERGAEYLALLEREVALHTAAMGRGQAVAQIHLGGGSPTFLSDDELGRLVALLRREFDLLPETQLSIEVDPRTVDHQRLARLRGMGFSRISFGVQDFDAAVQAAVHRIQPFEQVRSLVESARALGFVSINVDLIYGLPLQTPASFAHTLAQVAALRPHRVALYAYAHLPTRFKAQRRIHSVDLPPGKSRLEMLRMAIASFSTHGYTYIGMDHFALPDDDLAVALREGRLQRNFHGYSAQPEGDQLGLGVSAIGHVGNAYAQNDKTLEGWRAAIEAGEFATVRGTTLGREDLLRSDVIMALMCQGRVAFGALDLVHGCDTRVLLAAEIERLQPLAEMGLVELDEEGIEVTPHGRWFVRAVAMVFDRHLRPEDAARFSKMV